MENNHFAKLELGYRHGFTNGVVKIQDLMQGVFEDIRHHQCVPNEKQIIRFLDACIKYREDLCENPWAFIRCEGTGNQMQFRLCIDKNAPIGYKKTIEELKEYRLKQAGVKIWE